MGTGCGQVCYAYVYNSACRWPCRGGRLHPRAGRAARRRIRQPSTERRPRPGRRLLSGAAPALRQSADTAAVSAPADSSADSGISAAAATAPADTGASVDNLEARLRACTNISPDISDVTRRFCEGADISYHGPGAGRFTANNRSATMRVEAVSAALEREVRSQVHARPVPRPTVRRLPGECTQCTRKMKWRCAAHTRPVTTIGQRDQRRDRPGPISCRVYVCRRSRAPDILSERTGGIKPKKRPGA